MQVRSSPAANQTFPPPLLSIRRGMEETNSKAVISLFSEMLFVNYQTIIYFVVW